MPKNILAFPYKLSLSTLILKSAQHLLRLVEQRRHEVASDLPSDTVPRSSLTDSPSGSFAPKRGVHDSHLHELVAGQPVARRSLKAGRVSEPKIAACKSLIEAAIVQITRSQMYFVQSTTMYRIRQRIKDNAARKFRKGRW